mgnify:CR=1 FL=1
MNKTLILLPLALGLGGCTHDARIESLAEEIQTLDAKVSQLQQDVEALRPEVQSAKDEAARALLRISSRIYTNPPRL